MSPESLDALITDRELSELPPETLELLEAYLALHPEANTQGADTIEALAVARRAVVAQQDLPCSASVMHRLQREQARLEIRRSMVAVTRLAAGIALGLGVGWLWFARSVTADPTPVVSAVYETPTTPQSGSTFWQLDNFSRSAAITSSGNNPRIQWSSPVRKPRLEENP